MKINELPARTWNRLRMNFAETEDGLETENRIKELNIKEDLPEGVKREFIALSPETFPVKTGFGEEFNGLLSKSSAPATVYTTSAGSASDKAGASGTVLYQSIESPRGVTVYNVSEGSSLTVIQDLSDEEISGKENDDEKDLLLQTRFEVEKNAALTVVQIQRFGKKTAFYSDFGGEIKDGGSFKQVILILGAGKSWYGSFTLLEGEGCDYKADIAYDLGGYDKLDMNYVSDHKGKKGQSDIRTYGVLQGRADKLFRGTIDFHRGCGGSKGNVSEEVLIIDEGCENKTIPLILCDEEDVEGSHGASIGKPDDEIVFYMKSRGIPEEEIYRLIARGKISRVIDLIPDEKVRETLLSDRYETARTV